ncbi:MAG TPA: tonB-system energizer ExbB, partial [Bradyrhizobium sp.]|nr:tonB-system energizer ExbB [Bradyrhizobium sp.]
MMTFKFPAASALVASLAVLMLAVPCSAQQQTAPAAQPAPVTRAQPAAAAQPQAAQPVAAVPTAP